MNPSILNAAILELLERHIGTLPPELFVTCVLSDNGWSTCVWFEGRETPLWQIYGVDHTAVLDVLEMEVRLVEWKINRVWRGTVGVMS